MRGEYGKIYEATASQMGSPPLARGILRMVFQVDQDAHITPACAGNTNIISQKGLSDWDHPRMRGEYVVFYFCFLSFLGSPPHARGIL